MAGFQWILSLLREIGMNLFLMRLLEQLIFPLRVVPICSFVIVPLQLRVMYLCPAKSTGYDPTKLPETERTKNKTNSGSANF